MSDSVVYLYGFIPADVKLPEGGLLGIEDAPVERIQGTDIGAAISRLEASEFSGDRLEAHTADVEWMAQKGLSHEQVVAWFVDHATILPARLLTLFSSDEAVRRAMAEEGERIRDQLRRFADLREWDLRVSVDTDRLMTHLAEVSDTVAELDREIEAAAPGRRFLLRKKRADVARTEGRAAARRLARDVLDELRPHAREVVEIQPADDSPAPLVAALLVDRESEPELSARAGEVGGRLEEVGLSATLTGPWAPYRFLHDD